MQCKICHKILAPSHHAVVEDSRPYTWLHHRRRRLSRSRKGAKEPRPLRKIAAQKSRRVLEAGEPAGLSRRDSAVHRRGEPGSTSEHAASHGTRASSGGATEAPPPSRGPL